MIRQLSRGESLMAIDGIRGGGVDVDAGAEKDRAEVRYGVWVAASMKFLVPSRCWWTRGATWDGGNRR